MIAVWIVLGLAGLAIVAGLGVWVWVVTRANTRGYPRRKR